MADNPEEATANPDTTPMDPTFDGHHEVLTDALKLIEPAPEAKEAPEEAREAPAQPPQAEEPEEAAEEAAEAAPAEEPEEQKGSAAKGWAAVMKREKQTRETQQQIKAERHQLQQERQQIEAARAGHTDILAELKQNPLVALKKHAGMDFQQLADFAIAEAEGRPAAAPVANETESTLRNEVKELRQLVENQKIEAQIDDYKGQLRNMATVEGFELLAAVPNAEQEMYNYATGYATRYGEVLPAEQVAARIRDEWSRQLSSMMENPAVRQTLGMAEGNGSTPTPEVTAPRVKANGKRSGPKTLSNTMTAPSKGRTELPDDLTEEQELARAAKLIPEDAWDNRQ